MSDASRREAERDAAGGDLQAAARLLVERVRAGDLLAERLELAAHLGDPAACAALGVSVESQLEPWVDGLLRFEGEPLLRVEVAALGLLALVEPVHPELAALLPRLREALAAGRLAAIDDALARLGAWQERAGRPDRKRVSSIVRMGLRASRHLDGLDPSRPVLPAAFLAALREAVLPWALGPGRPA